MQCFVFIIHKNLRLILNTENTFCIITLNRTNRCFLFHCVIVKKGLEVTDFIIIKNTKS